MLGILLFAGVVLHPIGIAEPVLEARIADVDADGKEEIVAVTAQELLVLDASGKIEARHPVSPLTIIGRGLLAFGDPKGVRHADGRKIGPPALLGGLGLGKPAILVSPGDLDGDGRDDPIYAAREGFVVPAGIIPVHPGAALEIKGAEEFAVQYAIPVPAIGGWSGTERELVLYDEQTVLSYLGLKKTARLPLPLKDITKEAEGIRRNDVFLSDFDRDARLELLLVMGKGSMKMFSEFEVSIWHFSGGRVYDTKRKGFFRPATVIKVAGALLDSNVLDYNGDGKLDLAIDTVSTSLIKAATGTHHIFLCKDGKLERKAAWMHRSSIPLTAFKTDPDYPVTVLPDLDGDGRPELIDRKQGVRLLRGNAKGGFDDGARQAGAAGRPTLGRRLAVMITDKGLLVAKRAGR